MAPDENEPTAHQAQSDAQSEANLPKRRERLQALMARRESLGDEAEVPPAASPAPAPQQQPAGGAWQGMGGGGGRRFGGGQQGGMMQRRGGMGGGGAQGGGMRGMMGAGMQGGGMQGRQAQGWGMQGGGGMQRKIAARIMRILTQTPADNRGYVPGTPFTQTGVGELMRLIGERANADGAPGAKAAGAIIRFLAAAPEDGERIEGASVQKLQMLARRLEGGGNL